MSKPMCVCWGFLVTGRCSVFIKLVHCKYGGLHANEIPSLHASGLGTASLRREANSIEFVLTLHRPTSIL